jgi:hypothetical protein
VHVLKYGKQYTRRHFLDAAGKAAVGAGMLAPLWDVIARDGDVRKAYPDEALSIEHYSNGAVKEGGVLDASNVDAVKHMLDPVHYFEVAQQGRIALIKAPETDVMRLAPPPYLEATLRNRGKARLDKKGNVVTQDGQPWIGGHPFPEGDDAYKIAVGHALNWSRNDVTLFTNYEWDLDKDDNQLYHYHSLFVEYLVVGRKVLDPKPYLPGHEGKLRYSTFLLTAPQAFKGTSALNIWYYDQSKLPEFYGFLPDFKRVRRFTTNQRFEPSVPASNYYPTDSYLMGDPVLLWGNYKIVGKMPFIGGAADSWAGHKDNWILDRHGGVSGKRFLNGTLELIPEVIVVDMEPVGFPNAPYGKRRVWFDARNMYPLNMVAYDREGRIIKNLMNLLTRYRMPDGTQWPPTGDPYWSWTQLSIHNMKTDSISLLQHVHEIDGGFKVRVNDPAIYQQFCTIPAVRRLGK